MDLVPGKSSASREGWLVGNFLGWGDCFTLAGSNTVWGTCIWDLSDVTTTASLRKDEADVPVQN